MVDGQLGRSKWFSQSMNVIEVGSVVSIYFLLLVVRPSSKTENEVQQLGTGTGLSMNRWLGKSYSIMIAVLCPFTPPS